MKARTMITMSKVNIKEISNESLVMNGLFDYQVLDNISPDDLLIINYQLKYYAYLMMIDSITLAASSHLSVTISIT